MEAIAQALQALPAHFAGVAPTEAAAKRAFQAASQLLKLAKGRKDFDGDQSHRLER